MVADLLSFSFHMKLSITSCGDPAKTTVLNVFHNLMGASFQVIHSPTADLPLFGFTIIFLLLYSNLFVDSVKPQVGEQMLYIAQENTVA